MKDIFVAADNITSPLGATSVVNFNALTQDVSGVKAHTDAAMSATPFYASLFERAWFAAEHPYTRFEQLLIASITDALQDCDINPADQKTGLIISTTKGNISLLESEEQDAALQYRISLQTSAHKVATHFGFTTTPLVVSNACISGIAALIVASRLINSGQYENVVVAGADVISQFVLSGFQSFQAVSQQPCKPFDAERNGINLGEGAGTIILTSNARYADSIKLTGGAISNDANHISGPSLTGEELSFSISKAMQAAGLNASEIDFISAHGTATLYNDEMEAKAIALADMQTVPVNSLKGYYGHTLGASGLIEAVIAIHSMQNNLVLPTRGFKKPGVSKTLNVCSSILRKPLRNCLKIASGFGGCNAAIVLSKP